MLLNDFISGVVCLCGVMHALEILAETTAVSTFAVALAKIR